MSVEMQIKQDANGCYYQVPVGEIEELDEPTVGDMVIVEEPVKKRGRKKCTT